MNWQYSYTPYIWPSVLTVVLLLILSIYAGRRRAVPGALPFAAGSLLAALWAAGSALEYAADGPPEKILWFKFQAAWQLPPATAMTCFILEYAWPGRWLTRRNIALLSILPLLEILLIATDHWHHLVWRSFVVDGSVAAVEGPALWPAAVYGYGLGVVNIVVLVWLFVRSAEHRWPAAIMILGGVTGRTIHLLDTAGLVRFHLPLDILGLGFVFLLYAVVLFGFRIFDPVPFARRIVINQLNAGMLVLDAAGRVVSANPLAEQILNLPAGRMRGRHMLELLPEYSAIRLGDAGRSVVEFSLGEHQALREFTLEVSQLKDWRGLDVGRLLLLRDITEPKRTRELQQQQQLLLAVMQERESLARELHDSIGQVLAYAGFQVDAAGKLLEDGQAAAAADQLHRLGNVIRDAHADLREQILSLHSQPAFDQPFFPALQQYLDAFSHNYDIRASLAIGDEVPNEPFAPEAQLHAFRIVQEALSNARRHGHARHARVVFEADGHCLRMAVHDDGCGFTPEQLGPSADPRYGLDFMRERAGQLGGSLLIESAPGSGTRVVLEVPRKDL